MREIKVKLWYPNQKVMSVPLSIWNLPDWDELEEKPIVLLFTGLLDNSGIEIYEWDIVKIKTPSNKGIGIVELNVCSEYEVKDKGFSVGRCCVMKDSSVEVIGNIYENPELLKTKNNPKESEV